MFDITKMTSQICRSCVGLYGSSYVRVKLFHVNQCVCFFVVVVLVGVRCSLEKI